MTRRDDKKKTVQQQPQYRWLRAFAALLRIMRSFVSSIATRGMSNAMHFTMVMVFGAAPSLHADAIHASWVCERWQQFHLSALLGGVSYFGKQNTNTRNWDESEPEHPFELIPLFRQNSALENTTLLLLRLYIVKLLQLFEDGMHHGCVSREKRKWK